MKKVIALSLIAATSLFAADNNVSEQLGSISIVGDTTSHANNIINTQQIKTSNSVGNPLTLLNNLPGIQVTTGSSFGLYEYANQVNMRGFNKSQIAFLVDGVPLGSSATAGGAPVNRFVENENLSSVIAHQGSGSLATPSAAGLGGSINYITALPKKDAGVVAETMQGSYDSTKIFTRVDTGEFAKNSRAYLSYSETVTNKWKNQGDLKREHIDGKLLSKIGSVDLQANISWNNRADHDYLDISLSDYNTYGRNYGLNDNWVTETNKTAQTAQNAYFWDTWQNARTDTLASVNLHTAIGNSDLTLTPYFHDQAGTGNWAPNYVINADGTKDYTKQSFRQSEYYTTRYGSTLNFDLPIAEHELLAGAWIEGGQRKNKRYWYNVKNQDATWIYDQTPYYENFNRTFDTFSVMAFAQANLHFLDDNLIIDLGAKFQNTTVTYTDEQNSSKSQAAKESLAPFLPQAGLTYKLNDNNQIFSSFAMNYAQLPDSIYTGTTYDPNIKNEESTNVDLGYRMNLKRFAMTAALYYVAYNNKIENITASTGDIFAVGQSYAKNVGGVNSKGLEFSGLYLLSQGWKLSSTYTYTNATYTENVDSLLIKDKFVPFIPQHMFSLALDYKKHGVLFGLNSKLSHTIYGTRDNSDVVPDFVLTNAYIGYKKAVKNAFFKDVNIMMNINNLFDVSYLATAGAFGDTVGTSTYFVGAPRTATLKLAASF